MTFKCVAARIASIQSTCIVVVFYHTGRINEKFFVEFSDVLEHLPTFADPFTLVGDVNIRLDHAFNLTTKCNDHLATYGLIQHATSATHDAGGSIGIVCTRSDLPSPTVDILDVGISNHRLLRWTSQLHRPPPVYSSSIRRLWRSFDLKVFRTDLLASSLYTIVTTNLMVTL